MEFLLIMGALAVIAIPIFLIIAVIILFGKVKAITGQLAQLTIQLENLQQNSQIPSAEINNLKQALETEPEAETEPESFSEVATNMAKTASLDQVQVKVTDSVISAEDETEAIKEDSPWLTDRTESDEPQSWIQQPGESIFSRVVNYIHDYFSKGNIIVRVGAIILFFGVAFLLKYATENAYLSIEVRLLGVAAGGLALLIYGWKLRNKNQGYGLILQGAAIGVLYITMFVSFRLYSLLPAGIVFSMLILFSALAMTLAVLQNSHSLAVLSITGGFLAPVLTSTGSGSHVALFSYYAILNLGIFGVAWYRSWRLLNIIGFAFTFIIGASWGVNRYTPVDFSTTEPFLILFFILYSAIAYLYAIKQKPKLTGYVDSTLIFGLPLISFSLQAAMVKDMEFGLAWSAFALGGFYLGCANFIINSKNKNLKVLSDAYLALGIIFVSLVIPFALDGQWTSATWAIEGGGLVWVGLRQSRWFPKYFGMLIQIAGGFIFLDEIDNHVSSDLLNSNILGMLFVSLAALFTSYQLQKSKQELKTIDYRAMPFFFIWGMLWWYFGGAHEVLDLVRNQQQQILVMTTFIFMSHLIWYFVEIKTNWRMMRQIAWISWAGFVLIAMDSINLYHHVLIDWKSGIWLLAIAGFYGSLCHREKNKHSSFDNEELSNEVKIDQVLPFANRLLHFAALTSLILWSFIDLNWFAEHTINPAETWIIAMNGLIIIFWFFVLSLNSYWPMKSWPGVYTKRYPQFLMAMAVIWTLILNFPHEGLPSPLQYIPIINPLDIIQGLLMLFVISFLQKEDLQNYGIQSKHIIAGLITFIFIWLNVMLLRSIHAWAHIPYNGYYMSHSTIVQTSLSIFWTIIGLTGAIYSSRKESRKLWIVSMGLIAVVVVKLFIVDMANNSSIERIVSFLVVGLLLLLVGYYSPIPEKENNTITSDQQKS